LVSMPRGTSSFASSFQSSIDIGSVSGGQVTLAADVVGLLAHLSLDRGHVLGESLGGIVAQEAAIGYTQRVMKLILASRIPNARLVKVEGGSHALHVEMKRRFNREVLDFLIRPEPASAPSG
jgi:pimeloyl-ACP methyl ester carboxylesterase